MTCSDTRSCHGDISIDNSSRGQLNTPTLRNLNITLEELRSIVATNDKQRFSMIPEAQSTAAPISSSDSADPVLEASALDTSTSDNPADFLIRANQGHSIKVNVDGLLTPITFEAGNVPTTVVHGTDEAALRMILLGGGLRRMTRTHIHFAPGLPAGSSSTITEGETPVISGMRKSSTILIYIDITAALAANIPFFISANEVILTSGDEHDLLSYKFFKKVENRKKGEVVMQDGVLPDGIKVDVEEWKKKLADTSRMKAGDGKRRGRGRGRGDRPRATDDSRDLLAGTDE